MIPAFEQFLREIQLALEAYLHKPDEQSFAKIRRVMEDLRLRTIEELRQYLFVELHNVGDTEAMSNLIDPVMKGFGKLTGTTLNSVVTQLRSSIRLDRPLSALEQDIKAAIGVAEHRARTFALTSRTAIDMAKRIEDAKELGITRFKYVGPGAEREFCRDHLGNIYSLDEIEKMDNGQGLPVIYFRGGYNCRHRWVPVVGYGIQQTEAETPSTATPTLTLASSTVDNLARGESRTAVAHSLRQIDNVINVPARLPRIPVTSVRIVPSRTGTIIEAQYKFLGTAPVKIEMNSIQSIAHRDMAFTHEFGHFLDHADIDETRNFTSQSETGELSAWRQAVMGSDAYRQLREVVHDEALDRDTRRHVMYLLDWRELFARSFAQYIAVKRNDPSMVRQLERMRSRAIFPEQWEDSDFERISRAFDEVLRRKGLLR